MFSNKTFFNDDNDRCSVETFVYKKILLNSMINLFRNQYLTHTGDMIYLQIN